MSENLHTFLQHLLVESLSLLIVLFDGTCGLVESSSSFFLLW